MLSFPEICDLLNDLQKPWRNSGGQARKMKKRDLYRHHGSLFKNWVHECELKLKTDSTTLLAFLSLALPYFRVDRHYYTKEHNLLSVLARALGLGSKAVEEFKQWRTTDGDFGVMVEKTLEQRV